MAIVHRLAFAVCLIALISSPVTALDQAPAAPALVEFAPKEGGFKALLPGKPEYEKIEVGNAKQEQHQYVVGGASGAYLISYQDNPTLEGATAEKLAEALVLGRDSLVKGFNGKVVESEEIQLDRTYPGLAFRSTIPDAQGEARCRFYMAGTRLYQVMAIGLPTFAASEEATQVLDSFSLAPLQR
jgi:hypothetical protein